jgi:hypothetical protein
VTVLLHPPARGGDGHQVRGGVLPGHRLSPAALEEGGGGGRDDRRWWRVADGDGRRRGRRPLGAAA